MNIGKERKNLYILFGDLENCFDKLCLRDCIMELEELGGPIEEAMFIYEMNKNITAEVETPVGIIGSFEIEEVGGQGTILWAKSVVSQLTE